MGNRGRASSATETASRAKTLLVLSAASAAGVLHLLSSVGIPPGIFEDDAVHLRIARAILSGPLAHPYDLHSSVTDVLPGMGLLLAIPLRLLQPHWGVFRGAGLLSVAAAVYFTWRLARRALPPNWALSAALLAALSPVALRFAGAILPDLPLMALCGALFAALAAPPLENPRSERGVFALMIAGACLASLLRPQGAILAACVGLGIFFKSGPRRAALFLGLSLSPLAAWFVFNHVYAGTFSSYYSSYWRSQVADLASPGAALFHAAQLTAALFADALFPLAALPFAARFVAGMAGLVLAGIGLSGALRRSQEPWLFAAGVYVISILALHLTWQPVETRYAMPMLPLIYVFIVAAVRELSRGRRILPAALLCVVSAAGFASGAVQAWGRCRQPSSFQPQTMKWLSENTPPDARVESLEYNTVALLARRDAVYPAAVGQRDAWLEGALERRVTYLHVVPGISPVSLKPHPSSARLPSQLPLWARSSPYVKEVYSNPAEGTLVFRLEHPDPDRFLRAWSAFEAASAAARGGRFDFARKQLRLAVRLEPELALAWAGLGSIEADPAAAIKDFERAARADPTCEEIRADLAARRAARR